MKVTEPTKYALSRCHSKDLEIEKLAELRESYFTGLKKVHLNPPIPGLQPCLVLLYMPVPSHLLVAGFLPLAGGNGTAGGGRLGVAVFPAAVAVAGVVALLFPRGVMVFPLVGPSAVMGSLFGSSQLRGCFSGCTCGGV